MITSIKVRSPGGDSMTGKSSQPVESPLSNPRHLIAGLGNPGRAYRLNRHNVGFMLVDRLAERLDLTFSRLQSQAMVTDGFYENHKIILAKPRTYMNESGQAIGSLMRFYKLPPEHLLVAYDDLDLPLGTLRLRPEGGSGGHKGIRSIIHHLGGQNFPRLRLGIGRPPGKMDAADYVLQDFSPEEREILDETLDRAVNAVQASVREGIDRAMTEFNG
jgi:PTH1 family peptidyl-tRNA hydrolase